MRASFSDLLKVSPLYLATNSPAFAGSNRYRPSPALGIRDLATFVLFGGLLGLGIYLLHLARRELLLTVHTAARGSLG